MTGLLTAVCAATGAWYVYTALALGWRGLGLGAPRAAGRPSGVRRRAADWLAQAGLGDVSVREFAMVTASLAVLGAVAGVALFGGPVPALVLAVCLGAGPLASYRVRRQQRRAVAQEAWPRLIEEIRIRTSGLGRSVPQALFESAQRAPEDLRPAFAAAQREWVLTTDFGRTVSVLKDRLADPTADAACETLLVAHEVGGTDLDRRLEALVEDRVVDVQGRKDARSRQSGVRFARRFVLLVPLGMAFVGMSIGNGRAAYATAWGQTMVVVGIASVVGCWVWAGRLLKLPDEQRVFYE
jgi:tight adherence protein B